MSNENTVTEASSEKSDIEGLATLSVLDSLLNPEIWYGEMIPRLMRDAGRKDEEKRYNELSDEAQEAYVDKFEEVRKSIFEQLAKRFMLDNPMPETAPFARQFRNFSEQEDYDGSWMLQHRLKMTAQEAESLGLEPIPEIIRDFG